MKMIFLTAHAPSVYQFRLDFMKRLMSDGFEVTVLAPESVEEWAGEFQAHGISYESVKMSKNSANPFDDIGSYFDLRKRLKRLKPDAVFCDHAKMIIYGTLAAKHCGIKHRFIMLGGVGSVLRDEPQGFKRKLIRWILSCEYRASMPKATNVFFQNSDDADLFLKLKFVRKEQIVMVPGSGVNLDQFPFTPMPENHDFLFVGRLIEDKGLLEYMQAGRMTRKTIPDAKFHVIGYFDQNQTMLQMKDLEPYIDDGTVVFHGYQKNVLPFLQKCFAFVLPSYHEGTPRSVLEALSVGRPVITTDAPGCRETVIDGDNGYLVPIKDAAALSEAMISLCQDRDKADRMARSARCLAENRFDVKIVCNIQSETIRKAMKK